MVDATQRKFQDNLENCHHKLAKRDNQIVEVQTQLTKEKSKSDELSKVTRALQQHVGNLYGDLAVTQTKLADIESQDELLKDIRAVQQRLANQDKQLQANAMLLANLDDTNCSIDTLQHQLDEMLLWLLDQDIPHEELYRRLELGNDTSPEDVLTPQVNDNAHYEEEEEDSNKEEEDSKEEEGDEGPEGGGKRRTWLLTPPPSNNGKTFWTPHQINQ